MTAITLIAFLLGASSAPLRLPFSIGDNDYPAEARRRDIQGDAEYLLELDAEGKPTNCLITSSAGNDALDRATCKAAMRSRYKPGLDDQGNAVASQAREWIMWNLRDGPPANAQGHSVNVTFDAAGGVETCRVTRIVYTAILSIPILKRCETMGNAKVFADFLGRPTKGLKRAAIRTYTTSDLSQRFDAGSDLRRELAVVEFDQTRTGGIARCEIVVKSVIPGSNPGQDLCGAGGFQVTASGSKEATTRKRFTVDAVATVIN